MSNENENQKNIDHLIDIANDINAVIMSGHKVYLDYRENFTEQNTRIIGVTVYQGMLLGFKVTGLSKPPQVECVQLKQPKRKTYVIRDQEGNILHELPEIPEDYDLSMIIHKS